MGETETETRTYAKPVIHLYPLASRVLAVAKPGRVGDWAVYVDAVPGLDHNAEWSYVVRFGEKMPKPLACALFPQYDPDRYRL